GSCTLPHRRIARPRCEGQPVHTTGAGRIPDTHAESGQDPLRRHQLSLHEHRSRRTYNMNGVARINVSDVVDQSRLRGFQLLVLALCALCMIMDGFDVQAMGYVAPAVIKEWQISKASLGPVFGAGLFGMLISSLALGVVADRLGRRPVLIAAALFLALAMFFTAGASSVNELLVLRFVTGLAMGAIVPNAVALAGEYSPARIRVTAMNAAVVSDQLHEHAVRLLPFRVAAGGDERSRAFDVAGGAGG